MADDCQRSEEIIQTEDSQQVHTEDSQQVHAEDSQQMQTDNQTAHNDNERAQQDSQKVQTGDQESVVAADAESGACDEQAANVYVIPQREILLPNEIETVWEKSQVYVHVDILFIFLDILIHHEHVKAM